MPRQSPNNNGSANLGFEQAVPAPHVKTVENMRCKFQDGAAVAVTFQR